MESVRQGGGGYPANPQAIEQLHLRNPTLLGQGNDLKKLLLYRKRKKGEMNK